MSEQAAIEMGLTVYVCCIWFTALVISDIFPKFDGGPIKYSAMLLTVIFWPIPWLCFIMWKVFT